MSFKIGRLVMNILKRNSYKGCVQRRKEFAPYGHFQNEKINIPYKNDNNPQHTFDVILADSPRKNVCVIDIHGGAYIFGEHQDNYWFASKFVEKGYDAVIVDYEPNDGTMDTKDLVDDIADNLNYVFSHLQELGLDKDNFVITGDSAGGHFALLMSELLLDQEYAKSLGYSFPKVNLIACLVNCPVYDFAHISDGNLTRSGKKRMLGPNYDKLEDLCPKIHIKSLTCPVFVSTCTQDFLRAQSFLLEKDMKEQGNVFQLLDIESKEKHVGHVHNVLHPEHHLAIKVNEAMMKFIDDNNE